VPKLHHRSEGNPLNQQEVLGHYDDGRLWPRAPSQEAAFGMEQAYRDALAVRKASCQPRLEPEVVFGMKATPPASAPLEDDAWPESPGEQWTGGASGSASSAPWQICCWLLAVGWWPGSTHCIRCNMV